MDKNLSLSFLDYDPHWSGKSRPITLSIPDDPERKWLLNVPREKVLSLDLETTGLDPHGNDEILQIAICDGNGETLLYSYVKPSRRRSWKDAEKIHGITPEMVRDAPKMGDIKPRILELIEGCELLIGYNIRGYDLEFLKAAGIYIPSTTKVYDVMLDSSALYGKWNDYHHDYTFVSLKFMTGRYKITYFAHDALSDAKATAKLFYSLLKGKRLRDALKKKNPADVRPDLPTTPATTSTDERDEYGYTDKQYTRIGCAALILVGFILLAIAIVVLF